MPLDISGALLEGVRISEGNNVYSFPPRDLVSDPSAFAAVTARAEYVIIAHSTDPGRPSLEIADPSLRFRWSRNESTVSRFSYDSYSKRWLTSPGSSPDALGALSNEKRVAAPVPDLSVSSAPFSLYVGSPVRAVTFSVVLVGEAADFSPPSSLPSGTVQMSSKDGSLNFSAVDVSAHGGSPVLCQRQSFFDRTASTGSIGPLPVSADVDYFLFMSPRPAPGQSPLIRIGYGLHVPGFEYATESVLPVPAAGTFAWSSDTGRVVFSPFDVSAHAGDRVYYDGVIVSQSSLARTAVPSPPLPWPATGFSVPVDQVGLIDQRYVVWAEKDGVRSYWTLVLSASAPARPPATGTVVVRTDTGQAYLAAADVAEFFDWSFFYLDSLIPIEGGVSFQVFRSGVNGSGQPQVPDFVVLYRVEDQVLVDGISQSPFVMLPTVPVTDDTLIYRIEQGPSSSGTFTGELADGTVPSQQGAAYLLDLDRRQLKFAFRKTTSFTLQSSTPSIKLADAAISTLGFEAFRDGQPIEAGVDFDFDAQTGTISFTEPFGHNDPDDTAGRTGRVPSASLSSLDPSVGFVGSDVGKYVLVPSGPNVGIRRISSVVLGRAIVFPAFAQSGLITFDVRSSADLVADRFWSPVSPPYKKFSLASGPGPSGPFTPVPRSGFSVLPSVSQVNLSSPASPGTSYMATYVGLITSDDGATYTPSNLVELAVFKIRQETAFSTPGSPVVTFNPSGRTVAPSSGFKVYVGGVPLDPEFFQFQAPGTLLLADPVVAGKPVVLDYFVQEAVGGETSFNLRVQPMDLDALQILAGQTVVPMNGDQTSLVRADSVLWVGRSQAAFVSSSVYDPSADVTTVTLAGSGLSSDSAGSEILSCAPLSASYFFPETSPVGQFIAGSNSFVVSGDVTTLYKAGTVLALGDDAYVVVSSQFILASVNTRITVSSPARVNYIVPSLDRGVRPVFLPGTTFQTSLQADLSFPFDVVRMGSSPSFLVRGSDYEVMAGGFFVLKDQASFGDELYALYVAFVSQPAGTVLSLNYSYAIAPGPANGLSGQRLVSDYSLYAPDTFFYRVETVLSFIPEVQDLLRAGAASSGSSGPSTKSVTGMSNKDFGRPSLYFDQQHQGNLDLVTARLLLFYNDLINLYEDILANIDGRVVGGLSGRFRFDGRLDNPPRASYADVTNDIDDRVKLYDRLRLTGFFSFQNVPVYGIMAFPSSLSRLFPTVLSATAAINDRVAASQRGETIGSLGIENIQSVGVMRSSRSNQFFTSVSGTDYSVVENGQDELLVPPFVVGQQVRLYALDGTPGPAGAVVAVSGSGPFTVSLDVATSLASGSILRDVSQAPAIPDATSNHFYQPGRDIGFDPANGQLINSTFGPPFIPDLGGGQSQVWGNELIDAVITFLNKDIAARRVPALDGLTTGDDGLVPAPRLRHLNELSLLAEESAVIGGVGSAMSAFGTAKVDPNGVDVTSSTLSVDVGDFVVFTSGPNSGLRRTVIAVIDGSRFQVGEALLPDLVGNPVSSLTLFVSSTISVPSGVQVFFLSGPNVGDSFSVVSSTSNSFRVASPASADPGSNFEISVNGLFLSDIVADEVRVLGTNSFSPPVPPSLIGTVGSEVSTALAIVRYSGPTIASGLGMASGAVLSDPSADFILDGVVAGCLVLVPTGSDFGLYRVLSVGSDDLTVDTSAPFVAFPSSGPAQYEVIRPESFLRPAQWGVVSQYLRETSSFLSSTQAWLASLSPSGSAARRAAIAARQPQLTAYLVAFQKVLVDGKLYDTRYLWIDQRVNRQDGNFVQEAQADARRVKNLSKMLADQEKLLISESI